MRLNPAIITSGKFWLAKVMAVSPKDDATTLVAQRLATLCNRDATHTEATDAFVSLAKSAVFAPLTCSAVLQDAAVKAVTAQNIAPLLECFKVACV